ncbi:hypothetical protein FACS189487_07050 [Campylobacterota bacterium]|nr:hypothetical protein FACS189487_07050 [Campylobacterota bacterium]
MSTEIDEFDVVKVVALLEYHREFSGTKGVCHAPRVGDLATVVYVLEAGRLFIVEAINSEGHTLWIDDFQIEELSLEVKYCKSA